VRKTDPPPTLLLRDEPVNDRARPHGPDSVGAVLALSTSMDRHRDQPGVIVRLPAGTSVADLVERHADLFAGLRLPD
jgi:hypothetical protein